MLETEKREFRDILVATFDVYGKEISAEGMKIWWSALSNFSIEEVRHGFSRHIQSTEHGSFLPKPADIIRKIEGSSGDRGMIAWEKVRAAIGAVGGYRSIAFDDPIIHTVLQGMGGWPELCDTPKDELPFRAAEFAKRYRAHAENGGVREFPSYLLGRSESANNLNGFKSDPPALVGDAKKAEEVMKLGGHGAGVQIAIPRLASGFLSIPKPKGPGDEQGCAES